MYSRFDQFLTELDYLVGIIVKRSEGVRETVAIIKALWDNFQTPPEKHNSLHQMYTQPNLESVLLVKPGVVRRVAKELGGIGWGHSKAVAERFSSVRGMVNATVEDWVSIEGIGKKTAKRLVQELNGEHPS